MKWVDPSTFWPTHKFPYLFTLQLELESGTQQSIYGLHTDKEYEVRVRCKMSAFDNFGEFSDHIIVHVAQIPSKGKMMPRNWTVVCTKWNHGWLKRDESSERELKVSIFTQNQHSPLRWCWFLEWWVWWFFSSFSSSHSSRGEGGSGEIATFLRTYSVKNQIQTNLQL